MRTVKISSINNGELLIYHDKKPKGEKCHLDMWQKQKYAFNADLLTLEFDAKQCRRAASALIKAAEEQEKK